MMALRREKVCNATNMFTKLREVASKLSVSDDHGMICTSTIHFLEFHYDKRAQDGDLMDCRESVAGLPQYSASLLTAACTAGAQSKRQRTGPSES